MSYRIYTSDAFILSAKHSKDADLSLFVFTEKFGLLHATAKSARHMKSKLRYSLQSMTFGSISLVKGREIWRVTSAKKMINLYDKRIPAALRTFLARMLVMVERFCPREQPEPVIFDILKSISGFVFKDLAAAAAAVAVSDGSAQTALQNPAQDLAQNLTRFEQVCMLKLMYELGYVEINPQIQIFIQEKIDSAFMNILDLMTEGQERAVAVAVDRAIVQSHL